MRVEDCIVSVERRNLGGCIDLALVFARRFAMPLLSITLCFAVPSTVLIWLVADSMRHDLLPPSLVIFAFFQTFYSGALVAAVGPQVFGVPISTKAAMKALLSRFLAYGFFGLIARSTGLCVGIPLLFVFAWCGHLPEVLFLERTPLGQVTQRLSWLSKGGGYSRNLGRLVSLSIFWVVGAFGVFRAMDVISAYAFNAPILEGTIAAGPDWGVAFASKFLDDPVVIVFVQISFWLVSPIIRLAWFFCYLDQRIRNECWDLELQYRVESGRLEEQMA